MKLSEDVELLQYFGFGPMSAPPLQYILSVMQSLQSPAVAIVDKE
jgi:hypothetical protein